MICGHTCVSDQSHKTQASSVTGVFTPRFDVLCTLTIRVHTHSHIETVLFIVLILVISHKIKMFTKLVTVMICREIETENLDYVIYDL